MYPWLYTISAAFLAGTIPFGLLIARAKGVDIRKVGSGNIGATNVGRALGRRYFFLCFGLDFLKGFVPVLIAGWLAGLLASSTISNENAWLWLAAMVAPVLGHVFTPWLKFKGGKGVATSLGALLAVWPYLTLPAVGVLLVFAAVVRTTKIMSLASMAGGVSIPFWVAGYWAFRAQRGDAAFLDGLPFLITGAALAALVVWAHRTNIGRLRTGTEPRLGRKTVTDSASK